MKHIGVFSHLREELQPKHLLSSLTAGLVLGVIGVLTYITPMAALIFSGDLTPYLATGIGMMLFSAAAVGTVVALQSSFKGTIALPVPEEMTIVAAISASLAADQSLSASPEIMLLTIVGAIAITSFLTGSFLFALGQLKLGELIRFLPYPVIGGFLAGLGCLLSQGAFKVMTDRDLTLRQLPIFLQTDVLLRWLPGLLFAITLLIIARRFTHFLIMPVSFVAATALFYLVWILTGNAIADASTEGWLLGPFPDNQLWQPLNILALKQANWGLILSQLSSMVTVMLITALSLLMVSSGIELMTEREMNLNQELRSTGLGCMLSGFLGGTVGSHGVTTVLVHKMRVQNRLVGVFAALVYLGVLGLGISLISFFPKPVLGGLLLFLGLDLLVQWVYDAWFKLPRADYGIVLLIMVIIATVGFVEGVAVGLIVATILFVINYSRIDIAKYALSGANYGSHVQRSLNQTRLLRQKGEQIYVLQLQGLIFFGTANKLLHQIRQRLAATHLLPLRFIVLDFRLVSGLDSSAVLSFVKLRQLVQKESIHLLFTGLNSEMKRQLQQGGALSNCEDSRGQNSDSQGRTGETDNPSFCHLFPDLDLGMEWCEEEVLGQSLFRRRRTMPMVMQLTALLAGFAGNDDIPALMTYLEELPCKTGEYVFRMGDEPTYLYFVEMGQVSTWIEADGVKTRRLQTLGSGTILGEVEFFSREAYANAAIADQDSKLYRLSIPELRRMAVDHPQLAAAFRELMNVVLAERLSQSYKEIDMLLS